MKRMTKLIAAGAGVALIAGVAVAAPALAATARSADGTSTCAPGPGALWSRLPADLREDLRAARQAAQGDERRAAFEAIRESALAGDYGDVVQHVAEAHPGFGAGAWQDAPQELKDDVRAAIVLTGDARRDAFAEIGRAAAAGDYGTAVQERAQQVQNAPWWPDCRG